MKFVDIESIRVLTEVITNRDILTSEQIEQVNKAAVIITIKTQVDYNIFPFFVRY